MASMEGGYLQCDLCNCSPRDNPSGCHAIAISVGGCTRPKCAVARATTAGLQRGTVGLDNLRHLQLPSGCSERPTTGHLVLFALLHLSVAYDSWTRCRDRFAFPSRVRVCKAPMHQRCIKDAGTRPAQRARNGFYIPPGLACSKASPLGCICSYILFILCAA